MDFLGWTAAVGRLLLLYPLLPAGLIGSAYDIWPVFGRRNHLRTVDAGITPSQPRPTCRSRRTDDRNRHGDLTVNHRSEAASAVQRPRLAFPAMVLTVDGITQLFHIITGFSWPLSLAFGAIVAPIDPVLANLIAVHDANDDSMRVSLSSEVGMNDGTALPVLMLATAVGMVVGDVLSFGDTVERLFAAAIVVALGISLADHWNPLGLVLAAILFVVIRSLSVWLATVGTRTPPLRRMLIGGLGIRDIGSVNYIAYAFSHGLAGKDAERMVNMALTLIVASVIVHGIIVTPLLN